MPNSPRHSPHIVNSEYAGQRLDNYLVREWHGMPKPLIYRLIRTGQVRVNRSRAKPHQRLQDGDIIRIPPIAASLPAADNDRRAPPLALPILHEDDALLVVNKPAGVAVHGGSGKRYGVIERLRSAYPEIRSLELAHRLDKETSGVLMLAKKRMALRHLQMQWRNRQVHKRYTALVLGKWLSRHRNILQPLKRTLDANGNRRVYAAEDGKEAQTITALRQQWQQAALIDAIIKTGRTHQLRVHLANAGLPIVGDDKYGKFADNRRLCRGGGSARMFLHAAELGFIHPLSGDKTTINADLPAAFDTMGKRLDKIT